ADIPRPLAPAGAGPHLCAQRGGGAAGRPGLPHMAAFVGPCAAGCRGAAMTGVWRHDNTVELLENGEAFFPRVFDAIRAARREVLLETFILFDDEVGRELRQALIEAARRGAQVDVTVDGYGSDCLDEAFIGGLTEVGVRFHVFDPYPRIFGFRVNALRRLHRKLVVVDGEVAFVGGINYSADHLASFGPEAKQDYAAELR